jgi:AcrR family transcriptional regulator
MAAGRPRSPAADEAILQATIELFDLHGYDGLSIETVAERAGVAKSTVYRRHAGKPELVLAAVRWVRSGDEPAPDTGAVRSDLVALATRLRAKFTTDDSSRVVAALVAAAAHHPDLAAAHQAFVAERRRLGLEVVHRAVERGELPTDTDAGLLLDLIGAPIFYRAFVSRDPLDDATLAALVDRALAAFA